MKPIPENFLVVTDWNWLPDNIEESWVDQFSDNYLIYDRKCRWPESSKIKRQIDAGQNIYDMFDFIVTHYEDLPECMIFCKASMFFPKDTGKPRKDKNGKTLSNGCCSIAHFLKVMNNKSLTELNDFASEPWRFDGRSCKIGPDNSFLEHNGIGGGWYFHHHPHKYYNNINRFFGDVYLNAPLHEYLRFSPGGCYIVPKSDIMKYNKKFYEKIREIVSWGPIIAEAHMIERAIYTIFSCNYEIKPEFKS